MIYAFICKDGGDKTQIRRDVLLDHLRYIESVIDKIVVAGTCPPLSSSDPPQFGGSMLRYRADSPAEAR